MAVKKSDLELDLTHTGSVSMQKMVYSTTSHMNRTLLWQIEVKVERLNQLKASRMQGTSQCRKLEIPNLLFSI